MKTLFALIFTLLSVFAFAEEDFCNGKNACHKGYIPVLRSGTYYARGYGSSCEGAMKKSQDNFFNNFGNMECGLVSGPYVWSCTKHSNTRYSAWTRCNPDSGPVRTAPRARCALIGGRLFC